VAAAAACELAAEEDGEEGEEEDEAEGDGHDEEEQPGVLLRLLEQGLVGAGARLAGQDQPGLLVPLLAAELARPGGVPSHQTPVHHRFVKALSHHGSNSLSLVGHFYPLNSNTCRIFFGSKTVTICS